jgi:hypothetical protein
MALSTFYNGSNHIDKKTTQINALRYLLAILIRHILRRTIPTVHMAAATMINCHPQKLRLLKKITEHSGFQQAQRIINTRKHCVPTKAKNNHCM